jgi:hypothetical protein
MKRLQNGTRILKNWDFSRESSLPALFYSALTCFISTILSFSGAITPTVK